MKILVVDDSRAMRRIVSRTIRQAGFEGHDIVEVEVNRAARLHYVPALDDDLLLRGHALVRQRDLSPRAVRAAHSQVAWNRFLDDQHVVIRCGNDYDDDRGRGRGHDRH